MYDELIPFVLFREGVGVGDEEEDWEVPIQRLWKLWL